MSAFRGAGLQAMALLALVAAGFWIARHPDLADNGLPTVAVSNGREDTICPTCVRRLAWSSAADRLLTYTSAAANDCLPLYLHDLQFPGQKHPIDVDREQISSLSITPDGRLALVATFQGRLRWIDLDFSDSTTLIELPLLSSITSAAISHDGRLAAAADVSGRVVVFPTPPETTSAAQQAATWSPEGLVVLAQDLGTSSCEMRFSPSGNRLLWSGNDGTICLWDLKSQALLQTFRGCRSVTTAAALLPGDDRIISTSLDGTVRIWDVASGRELWRGQFSLSGVTSLALSPDGKTAAWGGYLRKICVWDLELECLKFEIETLAPTIWDLKFSHDGKSLAAAGRERMVRIYDAQTGAPQQEFDVTLM